MTTEPVYGPRRSTVADDPGAMNARHALPPTLPTAFLVSGARAAGVSRKRLEASDLHPVFHGVRSVVADPIIGLVPALSADQAFCGPTAAAIWDLPLPRRWENDARVHVSSSGPNRMRRPGVVASRRSSLTSVMVDGLPVLDPVSTWVSLGSLLAPWNLTAVADRLVSGTLKTPALSTISELHSRLATAGRVPGVRALWESLDDVRVGSWSRPETLFRLVIVRAGLPEPVLNWAVALDDGRFAYLDLAWPEFMIALEYDGRRHDDPRQRQADLERHERLADAGWIVVHVRATDLFGQPSALVARLVRRLRSRGFVADPIEWSRMPRFEP